MARFANASVIAGVCLSVFGMGAGDASAQSSMVGPGMGGILQGGACVGETSVIASDLSYYAGNGTITAESNSDWVQCPVVNVTGLSSSMPVGITVYAYNPSATLQTICYLHRVDGSSGAIMSSSTVVFPVSMTAAQGGVITSPTLTGGFYSMECLLAPGATLLGYYVNKSS